ncbi:gamma-glutamylcyclotransferase [Acidovorax sp. sic0104]|uniref:gamma-glutamylcyclotransferase family protein n=1 Tax=Acidovorax sp. sic0104 TaxID=2854784 RepID=UPI001C455761|nr:gamma-glutamylcyclotransferase family protein [Acidovorax sp. sic0104]MBV7541892.1 gamma-glutamylcyclotransferase [Acidovorax sp. sic0104]
MPDESSAPQASRWVFVYGTLRKGGSNDITRLQPAPQFVGRGRIAGTLYHLGAYPGVTLGGPQWVQGEVYAIEAALEAVLDEIESLGENPTDEYIKRELDVDVEGTVLPCLVYEINPRYVLDAPRVPEGDWVKFL